MTDPPPRKIGSLRDRIAAFENKGPAPTPERAPPAPRPKPAGMQWKPRAASPPPPDDSGTGAGGGAGLSAADAKESITKAGSLKDRMAALQGLHAFGGAAPAPATSPPPRPSGEKPRWKPPVAAPSTQHNVSSPPEEKSEHEAAAAPVEEHPVSPGQTKEEDESKRDDRDEASPAAEQAADEPQEPDAEEEERRRRAAIAARMARLGGARIGFAPPVITKKPEVKKHEELKPEEEEEEAKAATETEPTVSPPAAQSPQTEEVISPPAKETSGEHSEPTNASASSLLSPDPSSASSPTPRSPAMPVPAAPRRAAPPRKKNAKSPVPPAQTPEAQIVESPASGTPQETSDDASKELQEAVHESKEDELALGLPPAQIGSGDSHQAEEAAVEQPVEQAATREPAEEPAVVEQAVVQPVRTETPEEHATLEHEDNTDVHHAVGVTLGDHNSSAPEADSDKKVEEPELHEDDEDEEARRHRIAERLRQHGGFNPFSPPPAPVRRQSTASVESSIKSPRESAAFSPKHEIEEPVVHSPASPPPPRRQSTRKSSTDSNILPPSASLGRRTSVDSVRSPAEEHVTSPIHSAPIEHEGHHVDPVPEQAEEKDEEKGQDVDSREHHTVADVISEEPEDHMKYAPEDEDHPFEAVNSPARNDDPPVIPERHSTEASIGGDISTIAHQQEHEYEDTEQPPSLPTHTVEFSGPVRRPPPPSNRVSLPPPRAIPPVPQESPAPEPVTERVVSPSKEEHDEVEEEEELYHDAPQSALAEEPAEEEETQLNIPPTTAHPDDPEEQKEQEEEEYAEDEHRSPIHPVHQPMPPPRRQSTDIRSPARSLPPPPPVPATEYVTHEDEGRDVRHTEIPSRSLPPPPPPPVQHPEAQDQYDEEEDTELHYAQSDGELEQAFHDHRVGHSEVEEQHVEAEPEQALKVDTQPHALTHTLRQPSDASEHEILDDSDVDPVDPGFVSPQRSSISSNFPPIQLPQTAETLPLAETGAHVPPVPEEPEPEQEDEEQARRRTIAERMARLGGIKFGAPPPPPMARRPPPPPRADSPEQEHGHEHEQEQEHAQEEEQEAVQEHPEEVVEEPEEDEAARRQRIAARLAGQGGIRFGMFPTPTAPPPAPHLHPPRRSSESREEDAPPPPPRPAFHPPHAPQPPRHASAVPPPPPPVRTESDVESETHSDPVHVEAEESELEEVTHDDIEEEQPPPIPSREARRTSLPPPGVSPASPHVRPPIPVARPPPVPPTASRPPVPTVPSHGDFVMVEESDVTDEPPPLPPPRSVSLKKGPPARSVPPPPPPPAVDPATAQWESGLDFGGETDLSLSGQWSEDSTQYPTPPSKDTPQPPPSAATHASSATLNSDELMAQWGRVGVQIHEVATTLYEKSRKSLVGDRSFVGFISAVLDQVPNASRPSPPFDNFGYLIYEQSGPSVLRHVTDIMPGDIIVLHDAKLKGHKGISIYNQHVGANEAVAAIVGDFEVKKSKVKAFQANQHVGHDSVESVSYRLEDLKSGSVKIFRVLEA